MTALKQMEFLKEFKDALLDGRKTVTRRPLKPQPKSVFRNSPVNPYLFDGLAGSCDYGDRGDAFTAFGAEFEIIKATIERLQEISDEDMVSEGLRDDCESRCSHEHCTPPDEIFKRTWDSIYAAKGFGWDTNPWVWRIQFRRTA